MESKVQSQSHHELWLYNNESTLPCLTGSRTGTYTPCLWSAKLILRCKDFHVASSAGVNGSTWSIVKAVFSYRKLEFGVTVAYSFLFGK